jgi:Fibronectin type III-like domain
VARCTSSSTSTATFSSGQLTTARSLVARHAVRGQSRCRERYSRGEHPQRCRKAALQAGETRTVALKLKAGSLAYWDEKAARFLVEDPARLMVGGPRRT